MAYLETIPLVAGDDLPELNFTLRDANTAVPGVKLDPDDPMTWLPIDLTSVSAVRVHFRDIGGEEILDTMVCGRVAPFSGGKCFMQWNPETLDVDAGSYEGEIEIEYSDGRRQTVFDRIKFKVRDGF